jgi:hypothetical protein
LVLVTDAEDRKAQTILHLIDRELSGVPYGQQIRILEHVIEDLFMWRQAGIEAEHPRDLGVHVGHQTRTPEEKRNERSHDRSLWL